MDAALRQVNGRGLARAVLALVLAGFVLPIAAGLWQTGRAAFGILPAAGAGALSLDPWRLLADTPGLATSVGLTLRTGLLSTVLALALAFALAAALWQRGRSGRLLAPLLAAPHAAVAIGLAFLLAPSGWIARALSPWATGWDRPPDLATVNDAAGLALILGLMVKEMPFLTLVTLAALGRLPVARDLAAARALGYGAGTAWAKVILPQLWPLLRLSFCVVLAYGLSNVELAMILGPSQPPTLAVMIARDFADPDLARRLPAAAAAVLVALLVAAAILAVLGMERLAAALGRAWLVGGERGSARAPLLRATALAAGGALGLGFLSLAALLLWSLARRWRWPDLWPSGLSLRNWTGSGVTWADPALSTLSLALASTLVSLVLAILWLEAEDRARRPRAGWAEALVYLPLILPQVAFLFGLHIALLSAGAGPGWATVLWGHALFVFPYVMIALSPPWRALDPALLRAAAALGAGPNRRLLAVKLPCLLHPILTAAAIGFGVSVALYLPTMALGGGRIATLTTEAVTLASGTDRRILGVVATLQAALPWAVYALAATIPALLYRNRRGLRGAGP
jgi:putative thiamine transport system permease protein